MSDKIIRSVGSFIIAAIIMSLDIYNATKKV